MGWSDLVSKQALRARAVPWLGLACLVATLTAGCASGAKGDLGRLRRRLDDLAQNDSANQRRIEELNNRLFLLEDKVDTTRVSAHRKDTEPRLPVIRIRPSDENRDDQRADAAPAARALAPRSLATEQDDAEEADAEEADAEGADAEGAAQDAAASRAGGPLARGQGAGPGDGRRSLVAARTVSYGGAARGDGPRPVLRLHGSRAGRLASADGEAAPRSARAYGAADEPDPLQINEKLPVVPVAKRGAAAAAITMYKQAMQQYQAGRYSAAATAFRGFLGRYTKHTYADNALYWLGECFYDLGKHRLALQMFRRVVEEHPNGNKAPDALLKMGYCYMKLQEKANARSVLAQVVEIFPKSSSARLASSALSRLQ